MQYNQPKPISHLIFTPLSKCSFSLKFIQRVSICSPSDDWIFISFTITSFTLLLPYSLYTSASSVLDLSNDDFPSGICFGLRAVGAHPINKLL